MKVMEHGNGFSAVKVNVMAQPPKTKGSLESQCGSGLFWPVNLRIQSKTIQFS
jgi:hypothetical protein